MLGSGGQDRNVSKITREGEQGQKTEVVLEMSNSLGEKSVLGWACPVSAGAAERLATGQGEAVLGVWAPPGTGR